MFVVLRFYDNDGDVGLVGENVVCSQSFSTGIEVASDSDSSGSERDFLSDLLMDVPSSFLDGWSDELCTDVPFG